MPLGRPSRSNTRSEAALLGHTFLPRSKTKRPQDCQVRLAHPNGRNPQVQSTRLPEEQRTNIGGKKTSERVKKNGRNGKQLIKPTCIRSATINQQGPQIGNSNKQIPRNRSEEKECERGERAPGRKNCWGRERVS